MDKINNLKLALWNANGLGQHVLELKTFLVENRIDILLVSETHFTEKSYIQIPDYNIFFTNHPDKKAHGGSAIILRKAVKCVVMDPYKKDNIQATTVQIEDQMGPLMISAAYCPPKHNNSTTQYFDYLTTLGSRFICGGDYNAKNTAWGSRLTNTKGKNLMNAIQKSKSDYISTGDPTYWPTDMNKKPDLIDFFMYKGVYRNQLTIKPNFDLSSDHSPIFLWYQTTLESQVHFSKLYNKNTDWEIFRETIISAIDCNVPLKTEEQIDGAIAFFTNAIIHAITLSTPTVKHTTKRKYIPDYIRQKIKLKRKLRKQWQTTRHPDDKTILNKMTKDIKQMLKEFENKKLQSYLASLDPTKNDKFSLWKATKNINKTTLHQHAILTENNTWAKTHLDKACTLAKHFKNTFYNPKNRQQNNLPDTFEFKDGKIRKVTIHEILTKIKNINNKKSPGYDRINGQIIKNLPDNGIKYLRNIFNSSIRLKYFPLPWKVSEIIALPKPNKDANKPSSYRPISLLPILSKLFEQLIYDRLDPLIQSNDIIPSHQFGFRRKHSTIQQVHRVTNKIQKEIDNKNYCVAVYLDVAKAFDSVWHPGLLHKLKKILPTDYYLLLRSYLNERYFYVKYQDECSDVLRMEAGVPQGSVLGPLLYIIYTHDIPCPSDDSMIATFADDTVLMTSNKNINVATNKLQQLLNTTLAWFNTWGIEINTDKTIQVIYTNRKYDPQILTINNKVIKYDTKAKYLGIIIDAKLTWKEHILQKRNEVKNRFRQLYWLLRNGSRLSLGNKLLIYKTLITPIWKYGIELWGTASKSNLKIMQRLQSKILRTITNAGWYITNDDIHRDLKIKFIEDVIRECSTNHIHRLLTHTNEDMLKIPHSELQKRRLKRITPTALADTSSLK